jgi:hypothetical protein
LEHLLKLMMADGERTPARERCLSGERGEIHGPVEEVFETGSYGHHKDPRFAGDDWAAVVAVVAEAACVVDRDRSLPQIRSLPS